MYSTSIMIPPLYARTWITRMKVRLQKLIMLKIMYENVKIIVGQMVKYAGNKIL